MLAPPDHAALLALLPEDRVGVVERIDPITMGLSGAAVHSVTASRGAFVLRIQGARVEDTSFAQYLRILRRAADAQIAPGIVHVDEGARAVVSVRVQGMPMGAALANPAQRDAVIASVVDRLRALHALDASEIAESDPVTFARKAWETNRGRPGFPPWMVALEPSFEAIEKTLAGDRRRVLSHNDLNPGNVLWDGTRTWLVDWDVAGIGHPYYDLAALALFLRLPDEVALGLCARHDGAPLDDASRTTFRALRKLVGLLCGLTFLGLADDLHVRPAPTVNDAPSLGDCYAALRAGELDMQSPRGQVSFGLALLRESNG